MFEDITSLHAFIFVMKLLFTVSPLSNPRHCQRYYHLWLRWVRQDSALCSIPFPTLDGLPCFVSNPSETVSSDSACQLSCKPGYKKSQEYVWRSFCHLLIHFPFQLVQVSCDAYGVWPDVECVSMKEISYCVSFPCFYSCFYQLLTFRRPVFRLIWPLAESCEVFSESAYSLQGYNTSVTLYVGDEVNVICDSGALGLCCHLVPKYLQRENTQTGSVKLKESSKILNDMNWKSSKNWM